MAGAIAQQHAPAPSLAPESSAMAAAANLEQVTTACSSALVYTMHVVADNPDCDLEKGSVAINALTHAGIMFACGIQAVDSTRQSSPTGSHQDADFPVSS